MERNSQHIFLFKMGAALSCINYTALEEQENVSWDSREAGRGGLLALCVQMLGERWPWEL